MGETKIKLGVSVMDAARQRVQFALDSFSRAYLSFSGGKDSTVMLHIVIEECIRRNRKIGVLFIDWECQFNATVKHVEEMLHRYSDYIEPFWIAREIMTNNACSAFEPLWMAWDEGKRTLWTREKPTHAYAGELPFYYPGITFEEFTPLFGEWYSQGEPCACFVGIRTHESLNRWRTIARDKPTFQGKKYTTSVTDNVWNVYPIYDWKTQDIWIYNAKFHAPYNPIYDRMYQAGLSIHQMRIDEPFGDEARKNLWLYQIIEPMTWSKFVARMAGINGASLYANERGNILGNAKVTLPANHTWQSFANMILDSTPPKTAEHYRNKIAVYLKWYRERGYPDGIPDAGDYRLEQLGKIPAWRQICKTLLRNDYWCRGLGFGITKSAAYTKYLELMKRRRKEWNLKETEKC